VRVKMASTLAPIEMMGHDVMCLILGDHLSTPELLMNIAPLSRAMRESVLNLPFFELEPPDLAELSRLRCTRKAYINRFLRQALGFHRLRTVRVDGCIGQWGGGVGDHHSVVGSFQLIS
jgi:hypothetical protein